MVIELVAYVLCKLAKFTNKLVLTRCHSTSKVHFMENKLHLLDSEDCQVANF